MQKWHAKLCNIFFPELKNEWNIADLLFQNFTIRLSNQSYIRAGIVTSIFYISRLYSLEGELNWMVSECKELVGVQKSTASAERYSHPTGEETLETGESISKKLYG